MSRLRIPIVVLIALSLKPDRGAGVMAQDPAPPPGLNWSITIASPWFNQPEEIGFPVACAGATTGPVDHTFNVTAGIQGQARSTVFMSFDYKNPGSWNGITPDLQGPAGQGFIVANLVNGAGASVATSKQTINVFP